jgi:hypothetical protein
VPRRKHIATLTVIRLRAVDVQDATHGLLLKPLPCVPLADGGRRGQLVRGQSAVVSQRPIKTEPVTQINTEQIHRPQRGGRQLRDKLLAVCVGLARTRHANLHSIDHDTPILRPPRAGQLTGQPPAQYAPAGALGCSRPAGAPGYAQRHEPGSQRRNHRSASALRRCRTTAYRTSPSTAC